MKRLIVRKLIVDERNELFDAQGMRYAEFPSDFSRVREFTALVLADCPEEFREGNLLEQQLSEIIKNGIKHGNRNDPGKRLRVWYDLRKRVRFIVEDEGEGFGLLDEWNDFFKRRQTALFEEDFDAFLALEYWNGGMIFSGARNKVGVVRWFTRVSA